MGIYKEILHLEIRHDYFLNLGEDIFSSLDADVQEEILLKNEVLGAMKLVPTNATLNKVKNRRLKFVGVPNGVKLMANTSEVSVQGQDKYEPTIYLEENLKLNFVLSYTDPLFRNYSEINELNEVPFYYLDNDSLGTEQALENGIILTEAESRNKYLELSKEEEFELNSIGLYSHIHQLETKKDQSNDNAEIQSLTDEIETVLNNAILKAKSNGFIALVQVITVGANKDLMEIDSSNPNDVKQYALGSLPKITIGITNKKIRWRYIDNANNLSYTTTDNVPFTKNGVMRFKESDFDNQVDPDRNFPDARVDSPQKTENNFNYTEIFI